MKDSKLKNRLKKLSALENDSLDLENKLRTGLNFNITVSDIQGSVEDYLGEFTITMNNGDIIEAQYSVDPSTDQSKCRLYVNEQSFDFDGDWDESSIINAYKSYLFNINS